MKIGILIDYEVLNNLAAILKFYGGHFGFKMAAKDFDCDKISETT